MNILIIPDAHAHPNYDNKRFSVLGEYIAESRPDVVVCLGDFADMPSLCIHERGKISYEGRRYKRDLGAASDAMERLLEAPRKTKKKLPRLEMLLGNHENRISKLASEQPILEGTVSLEDLPYDAWNVTGYNDRLLLDGITFSHNLPSGRMGKPISGQNIGRALVAKGHGSAVVGHDHGFSYHEETNWQGRKVFGLCAGCYTHPNYVEEWNRNTHLTWWRGVVMLRNVKDGYGDLEKVSL